METTDQISDAVSSLLSPDFQEAPQEENEAQDENPPVEEEKEEASAEVEEAASEEVADAGEVDLDLDGEDVLVEADKAPSMHKVSVDGQETEVSYEELIRGYSGQAYIQKGMKEAAEARKATDALKAEYEARAKEVASLYESLQKDGLPQKPQKPDPKHYLDDPIGYGQADVEYAIKLAEYQKEADEIEALQEQVRQQSQEQVQAYIATQHEALVKSIPEFGDPKKSKAMAATLTEFAVSAGLPKEVVTSLKDAASITLLHKAWKYDQALSRAKSKKSDSSKTIKPGSASAKPSVRDQKAKRAKLRKSGDINDALALLMK